VVNERNYCTTPLRSRAVAILAVGLVSLSACASTGAPPPAYQVSTRKDAAPPLAAPPVNVVLDPPPRAAGGPPTLAPAQPSIVGMPSTRVNISANGNDLSEVISSVAHQVGLTALIDPSIHGPITTSMRNVSVSEAMQNLVGGQYQYRVQNGALVVGPIELVQKTYEVSYLQMTRSATASTVVAHNLAGATNTGIVTNASGTGTGVSSTSGGLNASGTDVIQSSSNADVWGELKVGLQTILFNGIGDSSGSKRLTSSAGLGGASASGECVQGTCLSISPFSNLVTVTATAEKQQQVADWLNMFKASITRQVYITAKVVEVTLDRTKSYGIDWSAVISAAKGTVAFTTDPASTVSSVGNASFNLGIGDLALTAVLNAVQSYGDVNVLASPATSAMNQQKASFNVTREVPFVTTTLQPTTFNTAGQPTATIPIQSVSTTEIGIVLDVLPQISSDNIVTMSIRPSVTSLVSTQTITSAGGAQTTLPTVDRRETDTMARVRSGETVLIGGLIQTQTTSDESGIPILMHLPGIGKLFSHTTLTEHHSEMVIFITPTITSGQPPSGR
jgi:MSHA biogenesis protein MshL